MRRPAGSRTADGHPDAGPAPQPEPASPPSSETAPATPPAATEPRADQAPRADAGCRSRPARTFPAATTGRRADAAWAPAGHAVDRRTPARTPGYDDVGAAHASVLANVDVDGTRLATLRERGGRTKQATAELAGLLVDRGYLTLGPDPTDRRAKLYVPTADGRRLLGACRIVVDAYEKWLDGVLGRDGVAALRRSLDEIARRGPEQPTIGAAWRRGGRPRTGSRARLSGTR
ncbi:MarR family winged helix-turn-helix transcriptional regulator [Virgisporangium ochraceum]|uniref:MarR family winged helix-turn-helix transcriptional regulator n=1 Tax=Virgisporangium ochraceum TaxID=65505 RepID=UPI0035A25DFA